MVIDCCVGPLSYDDDMRSLLALLDKPFCLVGRLVLSGITVGYGVTRIRATSLMTHVMHWAIVPLVSSAVPHSIYQDHDHSF